MVSSSIQKQSFWLFGVLVGLALKEAITAVIPHLLDSSDPFHIDARHMEEALRLFIFIILAIRFYLGATVYFDKAYDEKPCEPVLISNAQWREIKRLRKLNTPAAAAMEIQLKEKIPEIPCSIYVDKSFGVDFLFGFFHFVLFSALALSIRTHAESGPDYPWQRQSFFLMLLGLILLYDVLWLIANCRQHTWRIILKWALVNFTTVIISTWIFVKFLWYYQAKGVDFDFTYAEKFVLIPVFLASTVDIVEMILERQVIVATFVFIGNSIASSGRLLGQTIMSVGRGVGSVIEAIGNKISKIK